MTQLGISRIRPAIEHRQQSYSDLVVNAIQAQARGYVNVCGTSATEAAAGALSRAFASASISGPDWAKRAISPAFLAQVGRCLTRQGESLHLVEVSALGEIALIPAASWSFSGGPNPSSWTVEATLPGPSRSITRRVPFNSVIHQVWGSAPGIAYAGRSPLQFAAVSARLAVEVERSMGDETAGPIAMLLPVPEDPGPPGENDKKAELKQDITGARGGALLVETTAAGYGEGRVAAPRKDWVASRLGPEVPASLVAIMETGFSQMLSAMGCPPGLFLGGSASAAREDYRRWYSATVEPLSILLAAELSLKLETEIGLSYAGRFSGDLSGRARAFGSMVTAGMDPGKAAALSGLMTAED